MKSWKIILTITFSMLIAIPAAALANESASATVYLATDKGQGEKVGTVNFSNEGDVLIITTDFAGLTPGIHGFHVHEKPDCSAVMKDGKIAHAMAAGGHYDPDKTGKHLGPEGGGHMGDLPFLTVGQDGISKETFKIKGIKAADFKNRSIMTHEGGDNYSDEPAVLGGGGARIACGIIE